MLVSGRRIAVSQLDGPCSFSADSVGYRHLRAAEVDDEPYVWEAYVHPAQLRFATNTCCQGKSNFGSTDVTTFYDIHEQLH